MEQYEEWYCEKIERMISDGWAREDSVVYQLLSHRCAPIAAALRDCSPRFVASTYALCGALHRAARQQRERSLAAARASDDRPPPSPSTGQLARRPLQYYCNLTSTAKNGRGLLQNEPRWAQLEQPDRYGFCGLTASSPVRVFADPDFSRGGMCVPIRS
eukprot:SAG11_NODE_17728_length_510_cov_1.250608_1_plen_158_part_01